MPDIWALLAVFTKALMYFGILTGSGLVLVRFVFASDVGQVLPVMRKAALYCIGLGVFAALASFTLRGAALTGDASGLSDPEMLGMMWQTPVGTALVLRLSGLGLMFAGLLLGSTGWALAGVGTMVALWSFTTIGHLSADGALWTRLVLMGHLIAVSFWIGILLPLRQLANDPLGVASAGQLGHLFGQIAAVVISFLVVAGVALSWRLLGTWEALYSTSYGLALVGKLGIVAVLLSFGALNKLRVVPSLVAGNTEARTHLSQVIAIEWIVFGAVIVTTAALTTLFAVPEGH